jgi:hypothetical protein
MKRLVMILTCFSVLVLAGCGSDQRKQLEKVAKDWCLTIRASQVIPVYPLTEDVQPGDVFLVQTPIQKQAEEYEKKGFLPLDQRMTRFVDLDYKSFYEKSFGTIGQDNTPHHWQFPPRGYPPHRASSAVASGSGNAHTELTDWPNAPRAMFPSYSFEVRSGQGFTGALPIRGIPVGLSLMNADKASASVSIKDAYTYGVPLDWIHTQINNWALGHKDMLDGYQNAAKQNEGAIEWLFRSVAGEEKPTVYLRVISRVYLTGSMDVSLNAARTWGVDLRAGDPKEAKIPTLDNQSTLNERTIADFQKTLNLLNSTISGTPAPVPPAPVPPAPVTPATAAQTLATKGYGGNLKVVWAGGRSITMDEAFHRPLVIGYLGFDFPIMENGQLGYPVATRDLLTGVRPRQFARELSDRQSSLAWKSLYTTYRFLSLGNAGEKKLAKNMDLLAAAISPYKELTLCEIRGEEIIEGDMVWYPAAYDFDAATGDQTGFEKVNSFHSQLEASVDALAKSVDYKKSSLKVKVDDNNFRDPSASEIEEYKQELARQEKALEEFGNELRQCKAVRDAEEYFFNVLLQ